LIREQHQDDWVMRQVRALAAMVARAFGLRTAGQNAQALIETERALHDLTGADPALVAVIAPETLVEWIRRDANATAARELLRATIPLLREHAAALDATGRATEAAAFATHAAHLERNSSED
jgi:hypothetical protein